MNEKEDVCCGMIVSQLSGNEHEYRKFNYCPYCGRDITATVNEAIACGVIQ